MGRGSVGCDIFGFLPLELVLDLGSIELMDERPDTLLLEADRLNHLAGLVRNCEKPEEGDAERGKLRKPGGDWDGAFASGGLNVLIDGAPRRRAMSGLG